MLNIRQSERSDIDAITEIYNEAILTTTATFDLEPKTREDRLKWLNDHDDRHPILVAELAGRAYLVGIRGRRMTKPQKRRST